MPLVAEVYAGVGQAGHTYKDMIQRQYTRKAVENYKVT
jgi:hypothetical protein